MKTEETIPESKAFCIDSEDRANWLLRKLASIESEKQRVKSQAETILRQLDTDRQSLLHLYESDLQNFVRETLAEKGSRRKSLTLLQGTCAFRTVPMALTIENPAETLSYAQGKGLSALFTLRPVLDRDAARRYVETTGEVLPGVESVPAREAFTIKFGKAKD